MNRSSELTDWLALLYLSISISIALSIPWFGCMSFSLSVYPVTWSQLATIILKIIPWAYLCNTLQLFFFNEIIFFAPNSGMQSKWHEPNATENWKSVHHPFMEMIWQWLKILHHQHQQSIQLRINQTYFFIIFFFRFDSPLCWHMREFCSKVALCRRQLSQKLEHILYREQDIIDIHHYELIVSPNRRSF